MLALTVLVVSVKAFRGYKEGTLPREIDPGRVLVGSLMYFIVKVFLVV